MCMTSSDQPCFFLVFRLGGVSCSRGSSVRVPVWIIVLSARSHVFSCSIDEGFVLITLLAAISAFSYSIVVVAA